MQAYRQSAIGTSIGHGPGSSLDFPNPMPLVVDAAEYEPKPARYSRDTEWRDDIVRYARSGLSCAARQGGGLREAMSQLALYANLRPDPGHDDLYDPQAIC